MSWRRLREIFRPTVEREVDDELAFHIDMRARELEEGGVDPRRARALAEERFGPVRPIEEALVSSTRRRRQRADRAETLSQLRQDVRYAIRSLRHSPMLSATAIVTLALGIGATLAVFTVVNGVLVRPLPYREPERISMIWLSQRQDDGVAYDLPLSSGFYSDIERQARGFEAMAAFRSWSYALAGDGGESEQVAGARVSPAVALISHSLWQRRFGGDPGIVGRRVTMSGQSFTITGVMPPGFTFPRGAELPAAFQFAPRTDVWTPLVFDSSDVRNYGTQNLSVVGRLAGGVSRERAEAELDAIMTNFLRENAPTLKLDYHLASLIEQAGQRVRRGLLILLGAVACVLLIAGANVASLLVARVTNRRRELAVRAALGAGRLRIARQLVTENVVLASAGTIVGMGVAWWGTRAMLALVPGSLPRADDITVDWRVLGVAALVALVAGSVFGIAAAWSVRGRAIVFALRDNDARSGGSVARRTGRRALGSMLYGVAPDDPLTFASIATVVGAIALAASWMPARRAVRIDPTEALRAE
jgi:putative ABC transport system permease protein